jgi:hypothetical protein
VPQVGTGHTLHDSNAVIVRDSSQLLQTGVQTLSKLEVFQPFINRKRPVRFGAMYDFCYILLAVMFKPVSRCVTTVAYRRAVLFTLVLICMFYLG